MGEVALLWVLTNELDCGKRVRKTLWKSGWGGIRRAERRAESICDKQELFNLAEARDCEGPVENEAPCRTRFCWRVNSLFSRQRGGPNCLSAYQKKKKKDTQSSAMGSVLCLYWTR